VQGTRTHTEMDRQTDRQTDILYSGSDDGMCKVCVDTDRHTEIDRDTDRQTDILYSGSDDGMCKVCVDTQTDRQRWTDTDTDRQIDRHTVQWQRRRHVQGMWTHGQTDRDTDRWTDRQTHVDNLHTDRQTGTLYGGGDDGMCKVFRHTDKHTDIHTDRQTDKHTYSTVAVMAACVRYTDTYILTHTEP